MKINDDDDDDALYFVYCSVAYKIPATVGLGLSGSISLEMIDLHYNRCCVNLIGLLRFE